MYTTYNENGTMNNYASEPEMYFAVYPSPEQQKQYMQQAAWATLLVVSTLLVAFAA